MGPRPESLFGGGGVGALEPFEVLKGLSEVLISFTFLQILICHVGTGSEQEQEFK